MCATENTLLAPVNSTPYTRRAALAVPSLTVSTLLLALTGLSPRVDAAPASSSSSPAATLARADEAPTIRFGGTMATLAHLRNDTDFDRSLRVDDRDGQTDGQIASYFLPKLQVDAAGGVSFVYELELGWNSWSRNDAGQPNQFFPDRREGLQLRHRQLWGGYGDGPWMLRVGYQRLNDPSGLFLDQQAGLAQLRWRGAEGQRIRVELGQLAESSYEGIAVNDNNFTTDSFIGGVQLRQPLSGEKLRFESSLHGLRDDRSIGRPLQLFSGTIGLRVKREGLKAWAHLVLQRGRWEGAALGNLDEEIQSWALQLGASGRQGKLLWSVNSLTLSADNNSDGDGVWGAFWGSGRNRSRSVFLTEDERRDRYDNLDERVGSFWGPFLVNRAGLTVNELSLGYRGRHYIPRFVVSHGAALNPANALGEQSLGWELSLLQRFPLSDHAALSLDGLLFLPGGAAAAFVNDIDRGALEPIYGAAIGFLVDF